MAGEKVLGVISDTHGLVRPGVLDLFKEADLIIHAGDIGGEEVIEKLERLAPVVAVRGNCDRGWWALKFQETEVVDAGDGLLLYVLHNLARLEINPAAAGFGAVIYGHSHQPAEMRKDDVLYLNPGSAGPVRFTLPVSAALLAVKEGSIKAKFFHLQY
ncbi:MAG: metallophosphoesterase family protein [Peptococcaceae bacterium]|jgi:putative phosphoesterase|nr:metallophosphatase family protein [Peptococcaceae bacterium]MDH7525597.1 metallophosphoesterase family protein [Peptococcaceae bacterium]